MRKNSGSSLFLMELILAILIFSLASTVCVRLFVSAHLLSGNSLDMNRGVLWTQNLAEIYLSPEGSLEKIEELFPEEALINNERVELYFDRNWKSLPASSENEAYYTVSLAVTGGDGDVENALAIAEVKGSDKEPIYSIPLNKYVGDN